MDPKQLRRWRRGVEPAGGAMLSIVRFAGGIPGGMEILMGEGFQMTLFGGAARPKAPPGAGRNGGAAGPEPTPPALAPSVGAGGPSKNCNERPAAQPIRRCDYPP